jgi:predicted TIM-barrel fold metal-dependent hydrolase
MLEPEEIVDLHIHIAARQEPGCKVSTNMVTSLPFVYLMLRSPAYAPRLATDFDGAIRDLILDALNGSDAVTRGVLLALDGVCTDGRLDEQRTHYMVSNEYVHRLARDNPKVLWGASVNPLRRDAVDLLDYYLDRDRFDPPAALLKWIPNSQGFSPEDASDEFYLRLVDSGVPLLCHAGPEHAVPVAEDQHQLYGHPRRLEKALDLGVTVIAAHCATRFYPWEHEYDWLSDLAEMMEEAQAATKRWNLYADVSAMCTLFRTDVIDRVLRDIPGQRMVLGSDFPIPVDVMLPREVEDLTLGEAIRDLRIRNPIERNYRQLLDMGFPSEIGTRAAEVVTPGSFAGT